MAAKYRVGPHRMMYNFDQAEHNNLRLRCYSKYYSLALLLMVEFLPLSWLWFWLDVIFQPADCLIGLSRRCEGSGSTANTEETTTRNTTFHTNIADTSRYTAVFGVVSQATKRRQSHLRNSLYNNFRRILLVSMFDLLVLDLWMFYTWTPKFLVLPGTEGMAGYKNYRPHLKAQLTTGISY